MSDVRRGECCDMRSFSLALVFLLLALPFFSKNGVASSENALGCGFDDTVELCVTSAALTPGHGSGQSADISLAFRITNKTSYPVGLAVVGDQFLFVPQGAVAIGVSRTLTVSGIGHCYRPCQNEHDFAVFAPGRPVIVHVKYGGGIPPGALQLVRASTSASFSGTMALFDRGKFRIVPITIPEFRFSNGFAMR